MPSTRGRQVVIPLTNKSGGSVAAGDVVVIDTTTDASFTTTTTGRAELSVGVAQETIASNATGRVLVAGYAALVNVPASVTRGHYIETHTVVKQATGNSTRRSGSFGQFLSTSATPTAWLWGQTDQTAAAAASAAVGCLVYHNTTQVVNAANILFNSEVYDTDGFHSTVTNTDRLTVPAALGGKYLIEYGTSVASIATGELCRIGLNGTSQISTNEGESTNGYVTGMAVYSLAAGDFVTVGFTGNRTLGHASAYEAQSHFSLTRLGS